MVLMHHALVIVARWVSGLVGVLAFYLAFFMYKDEQGRLQNRLEVLRSSIEDRAKATTSTTVAALNKIADSFTRLINHSFGPKLFSLRAFFASFNLSWAFMYVFVLSMYF
jgi:hypothetical protein